MENKDCNQSTDFHGIEKGTQKQSASNSSHPKQWMTVAEMGSLLGLKKTDRYWLIHRNLFETKQLFGKFRVNVNSFETWYANQVKYRKVTGEEPGLQLKKWSYSIPDIARLLNVDVSTAYLLAQKNEWEKVMVDFNIRIPKGAFLKWYQSQKRYMTLEDREKQKEVLEKTLSMPEMADLLGVPRSTVYSILGSSRFRQVFEIIYVGAQKRITKESFETFVKIQNTYKKRSIRQRRHSQSGGGTSNKKSIPSEKQCSSGTGASEAATTSYLTLDEAASLAGVTASTISRWCRKEYFLAYFIGGVMRILKSSFETWLEEKAKGVS